MKVILQYFAVFLALFGPKFGFFDSRFFLILIMLFFQSKNQLSFSKIQVFLLIIISFLFIYSFSLFLLYPSNPEFLRFMRSFVSLITLPFIIGYKNNNKQALVIVVNVLFLHPIAIFLSLIFPAIQQALTFLFQFESEKITTLRYSGLTAGFDIAGYLSIAGFLICIYTYFIEENYKWFTMALIFYISVFLTSRTSVVVLLVLSLYLFFKFSLKTKLTIKYITFLLFIVSTLSIFFYIYVLPNLISTVDIALFENLAEMGNEEAVLTYAKTDPYQMIIGFIILPDSYFGLFFGENYTPLSDSGYIQTINTIGFLGLIISVYFYFKIYSFKFIKSNKDKLIQSLSQGLKLIILITLILCIKNQYMFTRGTFELVILVFVILNLPNNIIIKTGINVHQN